MFEAIRRLFVQGPVPGLVIEPRLAVAALLVHLAAVDGAIVDDERTVIENALSDHYGLDHSAVQKLVAEAARRDAEAVDFYRFTSTLMQLSEKDRLEIIRMMWQVVYADAKNHELEDNMVWRIAELIGVSPRDRTRLRAQIKNDAEKPA
jgi:uncharacterized tellurite resistance protein B-like protein